MLKSWFYTCLTYIHNQMSRYRITEAHMYINEFRVYRNWVVVQSHVKPAVAPTLKHLCRTFSSYQKITELVARDS
jgi:hypothetical protein